jgi:3-oxoacyl-[acyl-carrier-protein] synthase II
MRHRVVITGMGIVSPLGCGLDEFGEALLAGRSGVGPITLFDPAELRTRIAAEVKYSFPGAFRDRKITFAVEAARQALTAATEGGSRPGGSSPGIDAALSLGMGLELFSMEDLVASRRPGFTLPHALQERLTFLQTPSDLSVHLISHVHGLGRGLGRPPLVHTSACAAGTDAIGHAFRLVRSGRRRWMLAGGTDSMINPLGVGGFCKLGATSTANDTPEKASRPFDRNRDGFVLGEGAAMLVLERLEDARARGAPIHAEIVGHGNSLDAHGISEPHPEGRGAYQAMARCLADAGVGPEAIDCVNAHGSSTPKNDVMETLALKRLLGDRARHVPICSTKSMIGHLIAAAGAVEAVAAILGMKEGMVHPTINLDEPDPACDLDYVPHQARRHEQQYVLSSSFGFGGQNAAILLRNARWCDE